MRKFIFANFSINLVLISITCATNAQSRPSNTPDEVFSSYVQLVLEENETGALAMFSKPKTNESSLVVMTKLAVADHRLLRLVQTKFGKASSDDKGGVHPSKDLEQLGSVAAKISAAIDGDRAKLILRPTKESTVQVTTIINFKRENSQWKIDPDATAEGQSSVADDHQSYLIIDAQRMIYSACGDAIENGTVTSLDELRQFAAKQNEEIMNKNRPTMPKSDDPSRLSTQPMK